MKNLLATVALAATTLTSGVAAAQDGPDLVTIITSPEPQTQLMALVLTFQAAQQGANAHIMLCGPAGDIALNDAPESATAGQPPRDMSPQGLMQVIRAQPVPRSRSARSTCPGAARTPRCCLTASAWPHPTRWPHASWMPIPVS
jgi:hypothetical protein